MIPYRTPHELARTLEEIASQLRNANSGAELAAYHDIIIGVLIDMSETEAAMTTVTGYDA
jgi:hypothetical protein